MTLLVPTLVVIGLVAVNALYVAAEFGAVSVARSRVKRLADEGNARARILLSIVGDPRRLDSYIAACQVGITLSSLVLGAYGQATFGVRLASALEPIAGLEPTARATLAAIVVVIALTVLQVVFGELLPKAVALRFPARTALATVGATRQSAALFGPLIALLNGSGNLLLRATGIGISAHRHVHAPDELEILIRQSHEGGLLQDDEHGRLVRALHLAQRAARQLMVPRTELALIDAETPLDEAVSLASRVSQGELVAYSGGSDNVVGVVRARDLIRLRVAADRPSSLAALVQPVGAVHENLAGLQLLTLLRSGGGRAIVFDEFGSLVGLVTLEEVLGQLVGGLESELRPRDQLRPTRLADGRIRLPGRLPLSEAAVWTGSKWEGSADTVGGHVVDVLGHLPNAGDHLEIGGLEVEVEQVARRAIVSLLVKPPQDAGESHG